MDYPTLLRQLEGQLKFLNDRGTRFLGLEKLPEEELAEIQEGLVRIVPRVQAKTTGRKNERQKPTQMIRQFLDDQQRSSFISKKTQTTGKVRNDSQNVEISMKPSMNQSELDVSDQNSAMDTGPEANNLEELRELNKGCMRCPLGSDRNKLVFGHGNPKTPLMFIGEGPGADEDEQGEPFVGRAGKLLTKMIHSIGIDREDVYITNVVKCRPPGNRNPEPLEVSSCMSILEGQLKLVSPKLIVTLGNVPTRALLPDIQGITKVRGKPVQFKNWTLLPTFHPSYLLRNRTAMSLAWKDFRMIASMAFGSEG